MLISRACEYAIRAMVFIVANSSEENKLGIKEIAMEIDSPEPFTAKILQSLSRKKLINSSKGPNGGFYLAADAKAISLLQIVEAIDGLQLFKGCGLGLKNCDENHPCPLHEQYKSIREAIYELMKKQTVQQLSWQVREGNVFLSSH